MSQSSNVWSSVRSSRFSVSVRSTGFSLPARSRRLHALTFCFLTSAFCTLPAFSESPATSPSTVPAPDDFPAFQTGGALTGHLPAAPAPPLKVRWTYKTKLDPETKGHAGFDAGPAIVGDTAYIGDNGGTLHAVDLATGKARWTFENPAPNQSAEPFNVVPLVHKDVVYLGDNLGFFFAVDAVTGKQKWQLDLDAGIHASAVIAHVGDADVILQPTDGAAMHCLSLEGKILWTAKADDRINSAPAVSGTTAYVAGCDGKLRSIDLKTGKEIASAVLRSVDPKPGDDPADAEPGNLAPGSPVIAGNSVIVATDKGHVFSFDAKTLTRQWDYSSVVDEAMVYSTPAVAGDTIVIGARDRGVHAIDRATGKSKWVFHSRDDVDSSALIAGNCVYIAGLDKHLYVLDLKTGEKLFSFTASKSVGATLAATATVLLVPDSGGSLQCLETQK